MSGRPGLSMRVVSSLMHTQRLTMAEKASNGEAPPPNPGDELLRKAQGTEKISKRDAVLRSLEKLGDHAMPKEIKADVRERFALDVSSNYVSTTKADLLRQKAEPNQEVAPA